DAVKPDAPLVWDHVAGNVCIDADVGDAAKTAAAFATAAHVVRLKTWVQRVAGSPLEPRAALGSYDPAEGKYTLRAASGSIIRQQAELATILNVPQDKIRIITKDIGGNFGTRNSFSPEFALVAWASRRLGRPVKWTATRTEAFLSDYQGRDLYVEAQLA